ncbi:MAG: BrxE family protein [Proteobacteria bacterium]|jgi:hypothetical protein|nr:BrxE family protein [Pseudomonadota bacterium]
MNSSNGNLSIQSLFRLRLLVGILGEKAQFNWWSTAFFGPSSRSFLEPVFTRTALSAQYHGAIEAARKVHDEHLNVGCYHLFRLPEEIEHLLHVESQIASQTQDFNVSSTQDEVLSVLHSLAAAFSKQAAFQEGPVSLGTIDTIHSPDSVQKLAAHYWHAFSHNHKTYPYFVR